MVVLAPHHIIGSVLYYRTPRKLIYVTRTLLILFAEWTKTSAPGETYASKTQRSMTLTIMNMKVSATAVCIVFVMYCYFEEEEEYFVTLDVKQ